jgi:SOS response regulatory protein OraA/RecX
MASPVVTRVTDAGRGHVAVELDGSPWRVLPLEAVARSGLDVGVAVDRPRARRVRVELRRSQALAVATRSLRHRDHSRQSLADRLARSHVDVISGDEALTTLERAGLLDDQRAALARATALAGRDAGDQLIRADLEQRGFAASDVTAAIAALEPEATRVEEIVARRGAGTRTFRRLLAKGFAADALERLVADDQPDEVG